MAPFFTALLVSLLIAMLGVVVWDIIKLADYPTWVRVIGFVWYLVSVVLCLSVMLTKPKPKESPPSAPLTQVVQAPGSTYVDNRGGAYAPGGTAIKTDKVELNVDGKILDAQFAGQWLVSNQPQNGKFMSRAKITLSTKFPVGNLYLAAHAKTIESMDVGPMRAGGFMTGHSGKRDGFHFTNIPNAYGDYQMEVITTAPEKIEIEWDVK